MPETMKAVRKAGSEPGLVIDEVPVPAVGRDEVLVGVEAASVCGTDLHIWKWDDWAASRIKPPLTDRARVRGHGGRYRPGCHASEGRGLRFGRESHYVRAVLPMSGRARRICAPARGYSASTATAYLQSTFPFLKRSYGRTTGEKLPPEIATLQEPFGNAVFATLAHDLAGQSVAVLGMWPGRSLLHRNRQGIGGVQRSRRGHQRLPAIACRGPRSGQGLQCFGRTVRE